MGMFDVTQELVLSGADLNLQNKDGVTPLDEAINGNETVTAQFLLAHGALPNKQTWPCEWST